MRSTVQARPRINGFDAHEHRPLWIDQCRPLGQHPADEILLARHHATEAQVGCGGGPVELVARYVTLLDPHDAKGLEAVRNDTEGLTGCHDGPDGGIRIPGRNRELVGQLTREGDSEQPRGYILPAELRTGQIREGGVGYIERILEQAL